MQILKKTQSTFQKSQVTEIKMLNKNGHLKLWKIIDTESSFTFTQFYWKLLTFLAQIRAKALSEPN